MRLIQVENVYKEFGNVTAINGLNFTVEEGQICALLGHNGAGKTTALRLLLGLLKPDKGRISVFGLDPQTDGEQLRAICGVLSEDTGLYEPLTVYDNLIYYADIFGMPRKEAKKRIDQLLERFHITEKRDLPVKGCSLGTKKKVAIIRAILHKPKLLLLDEPTNGLDPVSTMELREMLSVLCKENKATILLTSHNLEEMQKLCDKVIIFRHGKAIVESNLEDLRKHMDDNLNDKFSLEQLYMKLEGGDML